jgi:replication initiation and membrane attachment protein
MQHDVRFYVIKKYAFSSNFHFLDDLYSPILGCNATSLYTKLIHEAKKQVITLGVSTELKDFLKQVNLTAVEFGETRIKLEALGLVTTYLVTKDNQCVYTFVLNEPLNFSLFSQNQKFRHLLIKQIGELNYQKLEYVYGATRISVNTDNVTASFESVFSDEEINQISLMNFDELYKRIAACTSLPIVINKEAKAIIESYFKNYDLSINEIERIIYQSIAITDDHCYHIDPGLLRIKFHQMINSVNNLNVLQNIKLNRNIKMFAKHLSPIETAQVFADYQSLNAEQYLRAIVKNHLTEEQLSIINILRTKYLLPDFVINLLVDFTIYKANGTLNKKYIIKVAQTINNLGLKSLQAIYDYFHFNNISSSSYSQLINQTNELETLVE